MTKSDTGTGRATILVVDDDEAVRATLGKILGARHRVVPAEDGTRALRLLEDEDLRPDLVLLDVRMPGPDGYEVCDRLQGHPELSLIPVVFVTVLDSEQDRHRALAVGGAGFVAKPFEAEELWEVVDRHLDTQRRWLDLEEDEAPAPAEQAAPDVEADLWRRTSPDRFAAFAEKLAASRDLGEEDRRTVAALRPEQVYRLAPLLGMSEEQVARHLADFLGLAFVPRILADDVALGALPRTFCRKNGVVPLDDGSVVVAHPFDPHLMESLRRSLWRRSEPALALAPPSRITEVFERRPSDSESESDGVKTDRRVLPLARSDDPDAGEAQRRASEILRSAIVEGASDVHLEPKEDRTVVRFRIDGEMEDVRTLSTEDTARIISRLKALADMDIAERRKPQDGSLRAGLDDREFKLRLATSSTPGGESLVVRILEPDADPVPLDELGMTEDQADTLREVASRSQGMILVVGPTGSGKSTTVFTLLSEVDASRRSLLSVEDPVEYTLPQAKQQEVHDRAGLSFEALLRSAMRQDPDILFLGEVRDSFSAQAVLDFASSGHLTISTLHSADASTAIFRLERLGVERGAIADALSVVVAQKLLRVLCPECKDVGPPDDGERAVLEDFTDDVPDRVARPVGCPSCRNTGYQGRTGVYEVLRFDVDVARMVREGRGVGEIRAFSRKRGDLLLADHALLKVRELLVPVSDARERVLSEALEKRDPPEAPAGDATEAGPGRTSPEEEDGRTDPETPPEESGEEAAGEGTSVEAPEGTILVVEDDPVARRIIRAFLESEGYEVIPVEDGVEALMRLGGGAVDAVISDLDMPNMDGEQLLEMMRKKGVDVPVLFVTGSHQEETELELLRKGARDFLSKPVEKEVLLIRLRNALGR